MVASASPKTGSVHPYDSPPNLLPMPVLVHTQPHSVVTKKQINLDFFFLIITCVRNPIIVFVRLTCPNCLFPIPKIPFERIEEETSESVSRPNAASE